MSKWSSDKRRGAQDEPQAAEGVAEAFMARPDTGVDGPLDPLDRRLGGVDPTVIGEKVVFRLWADGVVSGRAIEQARAEGDQRLRLDQRLVRLHLIDEEAAAHALAAELEAPEAEDADFPDAPVVADLLPRRFVEEALALPLALDGDVLTLAMADPIDDYAQRAIAMKTRCRLEVLIASPRRIRAEIARLYDHTAARRAPSLRSATAGAAAPAPRRKAPEAGLFGGRDAFGQGAFEGDAEGTGREPHAESFGEAYAAPHGAPMNGASAFTGRARQEEAERWVNGDFDPAPRESGRRPNHDRAEDGAGNAPRARQRIAAPAIVDQAAPRRRAAPSRDSQFQDSQFRDSQFRDSQLRDSRFEESRGQDARIQDTPEELAARLATPRFVRPKRVTRKNRVTPRRPESDPRSEAAATPTNRRFVSGFINSFIAEDPDMADFDRDWMTDADDAAPASASVGRRPAPRAAAERPAAHRPAERPQRARHDEGARRTALAEVRRALRAQAEVGDQGPVSLPRPLSRAAEAALESRSDAATGAKYQATRALADREAQASASRLAADSVLRHTLVGAPLGDSAELSRAAAVTPLDPTPKASDSRRPTGALGEIAPEDIDQDALQAVRDAIAGGDGLILFAGPAGSAKLASLRALAEEAAGRAGEIHRLDRPADRQRLAQANGQRIAFGEIRDAETAEAAVRVAMTGGLVFASIDAGSAPAAPERLINLGVPAYALASSLRVAATQALNEKGCLRCAQTGRSVSGERCPECAGAGVERRAALTEAMTLDDSIRALILARAPESALRHAMETPPERPRNRRPRRNHRAVRRIANAATSGAYGFGAP